MECELILKTEDENSFKLILNEKFNLEMNVDNIENGIVYCDKSYKVELNFDEEIESVEFYVNDLLKECNYKNSSLIFNNNNGIGDKIFIEYFGHIIISVNIKTSTKEYVFNSKYIDVAIRDNMESENIKEMLLYIMNNCEKYLHSKAGYSRDLADIKESSVTNLLTQISILKEIIFEYNNNFNQFKTNSKFSHKNEEQIDDFEKVKSINCSILNYILKNPQELHKTNINTGIRYNKEYLIPNKSLVINNKKSYNIYENKIVLGFLKMLYHKLDEKIVNLQKMIIFKNNSVTISAPYISSAKKINELVFTNLLKHQKELKELNSKIQQLYVIYKKTLQCNEIITCDVPRPSKLFTTIQHYKKIYNVILRWFKYGNYDFDKEIKVLSFIRNSQIYEYYILLKLHNYFINNNYEIESYSRNEYKMNKSAFYDNTKYENKFIFKKANVKTTIYYQPVIYNNRVHDFNVGLFRNNNINFYGQESNNAYYVPDFIIKVVEGDTVNYSIIDAKFSSLSTIRTRYLNEIIYKYVFSISTVSIEDKIKGVYIINAKPNNEECNIFNVYNSSYSERNDTISPALKILTLCPESDEYKHMRDLSIIFK